MRFALCLLALAAGCSRNLEIATQEVANEEAALSRLLADRDREIEPHQRRVDAMDADYDRALRDLDALKNKDDRQSSERFGEAVSQTRELDKQLKKQWAEIAEIKNRHAPAIAAQESRLAAARSKKAGLSASS
jgi:hypothetical protein